MMNNVTLKIAILFLTLFYFSHSAPLIADEISDQIVSGKKQLIQAISELDEAAMHKGIVHFENEQQEMKMFKHKAQVDAYYEAPAKSIFNKGCEILFENIFFFSEFCIELERVSRWIARNLNPLDGEDYTLKKIIVQ